MSEFLVSTDYQKKMSQIKFQKLIVALLTTVIVFFGVFLAMLFAQAQEQRADVLEQAPKLRSDQLLLPEVIERLEGFDFLKMAIRETELDQVLSQEGPFTVFAPFDEAFTKLPFSTIMAFQNDANKIKSVLSFHITSPRMISTDLEDTKFVDMLQGQKAQMTNGEGGLKINDATIIFRDIETANGIIHIVDTVLFPR